MNDGTNVDSERYLGVDANICKSLFPYRSPVVFGWGREGCCLQDKHPRSQDVEGIVAAFGGVLHLRMLFLVPGNGHSPRVGCMEKTSTGKHSKARIGFVQILENKICYLITFHGNSNLRCSLKRWPDRPENMKTALCWLR